MTPCPCYLKAESKRKYQKAREVAIALQTEVLGGLPPAEREKLLERLTLVADACREAADRSPERGNSPGIR